jgi:hypothetical protein
MRDIEDTVSNFIQTQFPEFYRDEGPIFILFLEEYYKWLETFYSYAELEDASGFEINNTVNQGAASGVIEAKADNFVLIRITGTEYFKCKLKCQELRPIVSSSGSSTFINTISSPSVLYQSRNLLNIRDLDKTADFFLLHFKEKYLKGLQLTNSLSTKKNLIKASLDLLRSKGSSRSIDLLFKLVFGVSAEVSYPGEEVIKVSNGKWKLPVYLELTKSTRTPDFIGRQITGTESNATAFVESLITRNINGRTIDIVYLSNVNGNFLLTETITEDGLLLNAPSVIGSLTTVDITLGGEFFVVGEVVDLLSSNGVGGKAIVTSVETQTGIARFSLLDGGWGYVANSSALISTKVLQVENLTNSNTSITSFFDFETVSQNLYSIGLTDVIGVISASDFAVNPNNANTVVVYSNHIENTNNAVIVVNNLANNILSNSSLKISNKQVIVVNSSISYSPGTVLNQSNGSANISRGVVNSVTGVTVLTINATPSISNSFHIGQLVTQNGTNASGLICALPYQAYHNYSNVTHIVLKDVQGTFNNTSTINAYPNSSNTTLVCTATPNTATIGYKILLNGCERLPSGNTQWFSNNTVGNTFYGNSTIIVSADVGGFIANNSNVTATGNVIGINATSIGIISVNNSFYSIKNNIIIGSRSNTYASVNAVSTGTGAALRVGSITDSESVRLDTSLISSNNIFNVGFTNMLISGANSSYGFINRLLVASGGSGYSNTDKIVFTGGSPTAQAGNAAITTDSSGAIQYSTLTSNVGVGYVSTPTAQIKNSSGGTSSGTGGSLIPLFALGFSHLPAADIYSDPIEDILAFNDFTIGTIASFRGVNPGENYNVPPFVRFYNAPVAGLGKYDVSMILGNLNGTFIVNENVTQTVNVSGNTITSNLVSGTNTSYTSGEAAYTTDGIYKTGSGTIQSSISNSGTYTTRLLNVAGSFQNTLTVSNLSVSSNINFKAGDKIIQGSANGILVTSRSNTLIVKSVSGTFAANATLVTSNSGGSATISNANNTFKIYRLIGATSNCITQITNTDSYYTTSTAKGTVKSFANGTLIVRRKSLFTEFEITSANSVLGITSYANASVASINQYTVNGEAGDNAVVNTSVISTTGSITSLKVVDSGLGYVNNETVDVSSNQLGRLGTGRITVQNQGIGEGYYESVDGFISDNRFIQDGVYYQDYSYEVRTAIPLDKYSDILKEVLHVAGTKFFGRVKTSALNSINIAAVNSSITII